MSSGPAFSHTDGTVVQAQAQGVKHIAVGYYAATQAGLDPALLTKELLVRGSDPPLSSSTLRSDLGALSGAGVC